MEGDDDVAHTSEVPSIEPIIPRLSGATTTNGSDFIVGHANVELVTFNKLNPHTVEKLIQEIQRIEYGNLRSRHLLSHQINRGQWPVLFAIVRLQGALPDERACDNS